MGADHSLGTPISRHVWETRYRAGVAAATLPMDAHLAMQATLQAFIDSSISKTIHVPQDTMFTEFAPIYRLAYEGGLKGCTTFRPTATRDAVLGPTQRPALACRSTGKCE